MKKVDTFQIYYFLGTESLAPLRVADRTRPCIIFRVVSDT